VLSLHWNKSRLIELEWKDRNVKGILSKLHSVEEKKSKSLSGQLRVRRSCRVEERMRR
jgi:hypothetical protein